MANNAREIALRVLRRVHFDNAYSDLALSSELNQTDLQDADRALVTELTYGVLRHRTYLDWLINQASHTTADKMELRVLDALRLGIYQLFFLDRVPDYAAVSESVALVPRRAAGLVNAVLRRLQRDRGNRPKPRTNDPLSRAEILHSHPRWILDMWEKQFGVDETLALARVNQNTPPAVLRVNLSSKSRDEVIEQLTEAGAAPTPYSPWGVVVEKIGPALRHPLFAMGVLTVQSEASQLVGELTGAQPGERVLDVCAAPGGKATHVAELVGPGGRVLALDVRPNRLRLINSNVKRMGIGNVAAKVRDANVPWKKAEIGEGFDRVLVDAPCTSLGTLAKQPELKWRLGPTDPSRLAEVQREILLHSADAVRPGGTLLYSVCTLTREETSGVVDFFLRERDDFELDDLRRDFAPRYDVFLREDGTFQSLPSRTGTEGMYAARFVRR
ncbi:MAG: 16S rRNA (cytosine(967)-C(5))-methyltransferase RsmB [Candidatus Lernaella stagnicola]|nr:16S rRNA (cytosine(967)-C(5))-methyltransferase RsmB [Candidatus Lernaella stagnicola]